MEKVTPIKVDVPVEKLANDDKVVWPEDMWVQVIDEYGNLRCKQCGSCFPGWVGHCEECEEALDKMEIEEALATDDKVGWPEDMDEYGNVRCRQCGSWLPGGVGHCEECEDYEAQTRIKCTRLEEIFGLPFVARDPVTGLLHVKLEPTHETDDAFNEFIRCFENLPLEAP